ncbi:MAG: LytTR family DNA-binding domain-containing protein [Clostridiales bacterium]|nr:LytTR family DNA-binding domain-containing protein [Clostridiales bacterium]
MIRIAIVEDEANFAHQMEGYVARYQRERGESIRVTVYTDGTELVEQYNGDCDIIFMDVQMEFLDGMTAAELIRRSDPEVLLIFVTNMPQYAIRGYAVGAMDYVLKPVTYFAFSQQMDKAIDIVRRREKRYVVITSAGETRKLDVSHIFYVESQRHTLTFHTKEGNFVLTGTMQQTEKSLASSGAFFRCNKGCLINLEHVDVIRDNCALVNGAALPISRGKKAPMMKALTDYVNGVTP